MEKHRQKEKELAYEKIANKHRPKPKIWMNSLKAFVIGGLVCVLGQALMLMYIHWFGFKPEKAGDPTAATLIFISCLLTGLGVYDRIGQWAGAGLAVPVTGFANSIASSALEHRAEGYVLGVGGNMFKLAGAVIVFGTLSAFVIGLIYTLTGLVR
ncbi:MULTISPECIES: stage V sporulation protein AC [Thermoactinomyces]|uniref:Stage V sporulation protein AC n=1 Tax=Thermoactinomyces daqus TaxID=1329516 RepID=A0A7W1X854_9BACL|nr:MULTISPECIES: stage V sporulation protein AC [Thermoactinomyces]MBA4541759.1 stage V sporulation protein AC [Thermoactinomyces daqus]MBH8597155.1 stage V sporulation protein AC [Thermoactinomyces sp. CICC 10523]MBH8602715.1 stage V sporulation protein AC [Thermoactinomyces sp. CICC 10522]MBH8606174.1 stage V sporulation protein AC [Thermoactinomyces sp. CICC 10521]